DVTLSDEERASLSEEVAQAGMEAVAKSIDGGSVADMELATRNEKIDGAASAKLEKDRTMALEDGGLTPAERKELESRLGKEGLDALEKGIADGTADEAELKAIAAGAKTDEDAKTDKVDGADKTDPAA